MKPQQRSAATRRRNHEVKQAALFEAGLPEDKRKVAHTRRLIQTLAEAVAAAAPTALTTFEGPQGVLLEELHRLIGQLNQELHWLAFAERRVQELRREHPHVAAGESKANVIDLEQRRKER